MSYTEVFSLEDVLHTLRECNRNEYYAHMFDHMLTFASELTGISEDGLMGKLYPNEELLQDEEIILYKDTELGIDLMMFISDYQENFDFSHEDMRIIQKNQCFGQIMLHVLEYLEDEEIGFDDINLGIYSKDKRVEELFDIVQDAYRKYQDGESNAIGVQKLIEQYKNPELLNKEDEIISYLLSSFPERTLHKETLLKEALHSFEYIYDIKREKEICSCGTLDNLADILGKDYRNSDFLIDILDVYTKEPVLKSSDPLTLWMNAIAEVAGNDKFSKAFGEDNLVKDNQCTARQNEKSSLDIAIQTAAEKQTVKKQRVTPSELVK